MRHTYSRCHGCRKVVSYGDRHACRKLSHLIASGKVTR